MTPPGNQAENCENKPQPEALEETGLLDLKTTTEIVLSAFFVTDGAGGRNRTDTGSPPRDFESRASTYFTTPARGLACNKKRGSVSSRFCLAAGVEWIGGQFTSDTAVIEMPAPGGTQAHFF